MAEVPGVHRRHLEAGESLRWLRVALSQISPFFRESGDGVGAVWLCLPPPPHALGLVSQAHV